ncbi:hypothetical protein CC77DRAFT_1064158 [Alternaria alternata]|uniref:Uncharacterized protein n=1 Tax=Alternaria alternata TaxID=5599 RepID=A0A177DD84_ALTAL|nr:hypothetical protein CC77DRAFT_1064158 [Alternaria alternata]OAG17538.1 hypothetical protein CC77DRAFT_1064158 [Alternaria alternata]
MPHNGNTNGDSSKLDKEKNLIKKRLAFIQGTREHSPATRTITATRTASRSPSDRGQAQASQQEDDEETEDEDTARHDRPVAEKAKKRAIPKLRPSTQRHDKNATTDSETRRSRAPPVENYNTSAQNEPHDDRRTHKSREEIDKLDTHSQHPASDEYDEEHEDSTETPTQELARLGLVAQDNVFKGLTLEQLAVRNDNLDPTAQPRRGNTRRKLAVIAKEVHPRVKRPEDLTRLVFLATLDTQTCRNIVSYIVPEFVTTPGTSWIPEMAVNKVRTNNNR